MNKKKKRMPIDRLLFIIVALFPMFSHLLLFWLSSQIKGVMTAFTNYNTGEFSLWAFKEVVKIFTSSTSDLAIAFRNTLVYFSLGVLNMPLSLFMAYLLYKKVAGHKVIKIILMLPGMIGGVMLPMIFQQMIMSNGIVVKFFATIGVELPTPLLMEHGTMVIALYGVLVGLGGSLPIWFGAMSRIPKDLLEYASLDGIGPWREFWNIVMPLIWPTFVTQMTFQLIGIFGASGAVLLFTEGKYNTWTLSYWIYHIAITGNDNLYPVALALGLCMSAATIPIVLGGRWFMNKFGDEVQY